MSLKQICLLWEGVQGDETKPGELPVLTSPLAHQIFGVPCLRAMGRGLNPGAESPGKVLYFFALPFGKEFFLRVCKHHRQPDCIFCGRVFVFFRKNLREEVAT